MVMKCPHCEEDIDSVTRTGENRYSCGECNMVISYDDLEPNLNDLQVIDKRDGGGSNDNEPPKMTEDMPPPPDPSGGNNNQSNNQQQSNSGQQESMSQNQSSTTEREKIYQRGTAGLREIKKGRLKNWLNNTDGVGNQTEQRILMVFDRNESVHKNPHVLYNLLDDELNASASYINTMVEDIFAPENEHSDLLQSQGYTPWFQRGGQGGQQQHSANFGGPMNATGNNRFSPGQQGQQQQNNQQQAGGRQQGQDQGGDDALSRQEAEMMMSQAMSQANDQGQRNALLSGLSDATDEAMREMAQNVGGLAGTVQQVIDEALVSYARENPEWVIENMDILQKVIGASEDMPSTSGDDSPDEPEQDSKVDDALDGIVGNESEMSQQEPASPAPSNAGDSAQGDNPDLSDEHLQESGFTPSMGEDDPMSSSPEFGEDIDDAEPEPMPTPGEQEAEVSEKKREEFESEGVEDSADEESDEEAEDGFNEIFGDMA